MRGGTLNSKVGEYAESKCALSNAFNAIVKTNRTSERAIEGSVADHPE